MLSNAAAVKPEVLRADKDAKVEGCPKPGGVSMGEQGMSSAFKGSCASFCPALPDLDPGRPEFQQQIVMQCRFYYHMLFIALFQLHY